MTYSLILAFLALVLYIIGQDPTFFLGMAILFAIHALYWKKRG